MPKKITHMDSFVPKRDDRLMLDTNILIKLFYPIDYSSSSSNRYEKLYERIRKSNASVLLTAIQISEFINRCIRFQFELYKKEIDDFTLDYKKDYRSTNDYKENMESILSIVENDIIKSSICIDDEFSSIPQGNIYKYGFSYDFNDALFVEIANKQHAILITDDSDFGNYNITSSIVTSNRFLLMLQ